MADPRGTASLARLAASFDRHFPAPADTRDGQTVSVPVHEWRQLKAAIEAQPMTAVIPAGLEGDARLHALSIAWCSARLNSLREAWLNPPEWTEVQAEPAPHGMTESPYPPRIVARKGCEQLLAQRTLTKLYNERPQWLDDASKALDIAVARAYGWTDYTPDMPDDELLRRMLALNLQSAEGARHAAGCGAQASMFAREVA